MNRNPVLRCEGKCTGPGVTPHTFAEETTLTYMNGDVRGYEQIFSCDDCGKKRRFGYTAQGDSKSYPKKLDPKVDVDWQAIAKERAQA